MSPPKSCARVGPAKKIRLTVDRSTIRADRNDLAYVTVEITDAAGNLLPDATNLVHFKLTGPGELAAVGSGAPNVMESFRQPQHTAWHGRCLAILRPKGASGDHDAHGRSRRPGHRNGCCQNTRLGRGPAAWQLSG